MILYFYFYSTKFTCKKINDIYAFKSTLPYLPLATCCLPHCKSISSSSCFIFSSFINWTSDADLVRFRAALLQLRRRRRRLLLPRDYLVVLALLLCLIRNSHHFLFGLKLFKSDEAFQGPPRRPFPAASSRLFYALLARSGFLFIFIFFFFFLFFYYVYFYDFV